MVGAVIYVSLAVALLADGSVESTGILMSSAGAVPAVVTAVAVLGATTAVQIHTKHVSGGHILMSTFISVAGVLIWAPWVLALVAGLYLMGNWGPRQLRDRALRELALRGALGYLTRTVPDGAGELGAPGMYELRWIDLAPSLTDARPLYVVFRGIDIHSGIATEILKQSGAARYSGTSEAWRSALCALLKWSPTVPDLDLERLVQRAPARFASENVRMQQALHERQEDGVELLQARAPAQLLQPAYIVRLMASWGKWRIILIEAHCSGNDLALYADAARQQMTFAKLELVMTPA